MILKLHKYQDLENIGRLARSISVEPLFLRGPAGPICKRSQTDLIVDGPHKDINLATLDPEFLEGKKTT